MKRTLKRELKVLEIVEREAIGCSCAARPRVIPWGGFWCGPLASVGRACGTNAGDAPRRCRAPGRGGIALQDIGAVRTLAKGPQSARLETRTKESNMCASPRVANPSAQGN